MQTTVQLHLKTHKQLALHTVVFLPPYAGYNSCFSYTRLQAQLLRDIRTYPAAYGRRFCSEAV